MMASGKKVCGRAEDVTSSGWLSDMKRRQYFWVDFKWNCFPLLVCRIYIALYYING